MLIKAKELAKGNIADELDEWIETSNNPTAKVEAITKIYNQLEVRKLAMMVMEDYVNNALHALDQIAVEADKKDLLKGFAEQLLIREQ